MDFEEMDFEYEPTLLTCTDEDGNEVVFEQIDLITYKDGNDYALISPYDPNGALELMPQNTISVCVNTIDDEAVMIPIDDDALYHELQNIFEERLNELYDFED